MWILDAKALGTAATTSAVFRLIEIRKRDYKSDYASDTTRNGLFYNP